MEWHAKAFGELTLEELYEILRLRVDVFVVEQRCPYPELDGKDRAALHLFARDEQGIQAYLRILPPGVSFPEASLGRVVTIARGQGLGAQLLDRGLQAAEAWLDALAAKWKKGQPHYEYQHLMAIFTIPALRDLPQPSGEELARAVQALWVQRWPKSPIGLGSYDEITAGFQKKLCYITSAVCRVQGKTDDCYELTAFRRFRDQVMLRSDNGRALVEEYYRLAPAIVTSVGLCQDEAAVYSSVYQDYLLPCLTLLEQGDNTGCRDKYVEMVRYMEKAYLPQ